MKYLVFSDLHGGAKHAKMIIEKFKSNKCDMMLCLGDVLYHGPRNDLPSDYNPKEVINILNPYAKKIIAVKGNCDAEVDQMVLDFKINDDYMLDDFNKKIKLVHGHHLDKIKETDLNIVLYGHTHIHKADLIKNTLYLNPGSTTIPKNGQPESYAILDRDAFVIYNFNDEVLLKQDI